MATSLLLLLPPIDAQVGDQRVLPDRTPAIARACRGEGFLFARVAKGSRAAWDSTGRDQLARERAGHLCWWKPKTGERLLQAHPERSNRDDALPVILVESTPTLRSALLLRTARKGEVLLATGPGKILPEHGAGLHDPSVRGPPAPGTQL